jgi:hypothetical protein
MFNGDLLVNKVLILSLGYFFCKDELIPQFYSWSVLLSGGFGVMLKIDNI